MRNKSYSGLWERWSPLILAVIAATCLIVALSAGPVVGAPYLIVSQFIIAGFTIQSFSNEYALFKKPELAKAISQGSLKIVAGIALLAYVFVINGLSHLTVALWLSASIGFFLSSLTDLVEIPARIREEKDHQEVREAMTAFSKKQEKKQEESLHMQNSLVESLAFLNDIRPKNK